MNELIDKQVALDAIEAIKLGLWEIDIPSPTVPEYVEHHEQIANMMWICDNWIKRIRELPSVQPEKLTDKEQRIFLSAMGREEEVCKEVDDAWGDCREPYEDSLVHVCKEIRRKVKGALWT